jgi:hypothetical protein
MTDFAALYSFYRQYLWEKLNSEFGHSIDESLATKLNLFLVKNASLPKFHDVVSSSIYPHMIGCHNPVLPDNLVVVLLVF